MTVGAGRSSVQKPLVRHAVEAGWEYLRPEEALRMRQPAAFRAEVIVHELLHLKVPNHGRLFKALVRAYLRTDGERPHPR